MTNPEPASPMPLRHMRPDAAYTQMEINHHYVDQRAFLGELIQLVDQIDRDVDHPALEGIRALVAKIKHRFGL